MPRWNSQDGRNDERIQGVVDRFRVLAYRLEWAGQIEPGAAQRPVIAAILSEVVSVVSNASLLEIFAPTAEARRARGT
jgi:hypothetical protein